MKKLLLVLIFSISVFGEEIVYVGRSPRAQMMGDAWTALSNKDEYTLFYNPASLGGNYSVALNPVNVRLSTTNAVDLDFSLDDGVSADVDDSRFKNFPSGDSAAIADRLMGFPLYIEASTFPGMKMMHFAFNLFASNKTSLVLRNQVHPSLEIDYRYDRGFAAGFAYNLIGGMTSKGKVASGQRLSIGYGLKYIRREGIKNKFDLISTGVLNDINNAGSAGDIKNAFGFAEGKAFGHDLGLEYSIGNGASEWTTGLSILNVGDIKFRDLTKNGNKVPEQEMYVNFGTAFKQDFTFFEWGAALDIKPINAPINWGRMLAMGMYFELPFLNFYTGWGQGYFNYGFGFDIFFARLDVGFYSTELENEYKEREGERMVIYLSLFDGEFDIF